MFDLTQDEELAILSGPRNLAAALQILTYAATRKDGVTCDDCSAGLGLVHQIASARYHDLVQAGCLIPTKKKRATRIGSAAAIHKIAPNVRFKDYVKHVHTFQYRKKKHPGLTPEEQGVLTAGMAFLDAWKRAKTSKGREEAAVTLINRLGTLAKG